MRTRIRIDRAQREDHAALAQFLISAGLDALVPDRDLENWIVARHGDSIVGCGSLKLSGSLAFLRYVAVAASHRRRSIGSTLVSVLLDTAAECGASTVYVAARDAAGFFERLHWRPVGGTEPAAIDPGLCDGSSVFAVSLAQRASMAAIWPKTA